VGHGSSGAGPYAEMRSWDVRRSAGTADARELASGGFCVFAVVFDVRLCGFDGVVRGVMMMAAREVGMMRGEMMIVRFVWICRFAMMTCRVVMMFGCFVMMLNSVSGHWSAPSF
jgi:hypothetical protein